MSKMALLDAQYSPSGNSVGKQMVILDAWEEYNKTRVPKVYSNFT